MARIATHVLHALAGRERAAGSDLWSLALRCHMDAVFHAGCSSASFGLGTLHCRQCLPDGILPKPIARKQHFTHKPYTQECLCVCGINCKANYHVLQIGDVLNDPGISGWGKKCIIRSTPYAYNKMASLVNKLIVINSPTTGLGSLSPAEVLMQPTPSRPRS